MKNYKYDDYDILERFCIMTVDGHKTDGDAFNYLRNKITPEQLKTLQESITPKKENASGHGDGLQEYIKNKIGLYPCTDKVHPLCKIYDEQKNIIDANIIKDAETLQSWKQRNVSIFAFYPEHNNLIVLDLDNSDEHANTTNGIKNFLDLIAGVELTEKNKKYFSDFPHNFPCYVETPHNGLHLYFKNSYIPKSWTPNKDELTKLNIEIKYNNQVTAAGSVRNGKTYNLRGNLQDAPRMTTDLIELFTKGKPVKQPAAKREYRPQNGESWNATPDGIINKAMEKYSNLGNHDFIYKTAVLFKNAGFTKEIATEYIQQTPQHLERKDQADTITAINSVF